MLDPLLSSAKLHQTAPNYTKLHRAHVGTSAEQRQTAPGLSPDALKDGKDTLFCDWLSHHSALAKVCLYFCIFKTRMTQIRLKS